MNQTHLMTDKDLVCLYRGGNNRALEELLKRYKSRIFSTIYHLVNDSDLAEDLFQDTFIRIITSIKKKRYHEEGKFAPWALRIAHNIVIDHFRASKHMHMVRETEEFSMFDILPEESLSASEEIIHHEKEAEKVKFVRAMIERLPEHQRIVVILRHYGELQFNEIAEALDININTALGRMHYAMLTMKEMMKENPMAEKTLRRMPKRNDQGTK